MPSVDYKKAIYAFPPHPTDKVVTALKGVFTIPANVFNSSTFTYSQEKGQYVIPNPTGKLLLPIALYRFDDSLTVEDDYIGDGFTFIPGLEFYTLVSTSSITIKWKQNGGANSGRSVVYSIALLSMT